jgi:hypothetical protein
MRKVILLLFVFCTSIIARHDLENIREQFAKINISLLNSAPPSLRKIEDLKQLIISINDISNEQYDLTECIKELEYFTEVINNESNVDSLKKCFRSVNNKFNSITGIYFYNRVINSSNKKIIVFSTSMSCECTLEQCYRQEAEVQKFCSENNYEYAVVDCWEEFEPQQKYDVGFIPTILVLDEKNSITGKYVRSEKLNDLLINLIEKN